MSKSGKRGILPLLKAAIAHVLVTYALLKEKDGLNVGSVIPSKAADQSRH